MQNASAPDPELIASMSRGDRQALAMIYERHAGRLLTLVRHILDDRAEAEDVLHDTFLEAWQRAADYSPERGSVAAWLAVRARSRALDRRRAPGRRAVPLLDDELNERLKPTEGPDLERRVETQRLGVALSGMSAEERQVLLLGYFAGLSSSEIATEVGIPLGTVKSRVRSALGKLREWLGEPGDPQ